MAMPLRQSIKVATYLAEQKLRKRDKFPLIVELEPLFACNLKCEGCGKIQHPDHVLKRRMPVDQAVLDFHPLEELAGDNGNRVLRGLLVAASREMVNANLEAVTKAGLSPTLSQRGSARAHR